MDAQLERKLAELADRQEILQVMHRYCRGLDRLDRELLRSCYWDDAIDDHGDFVGTPDSFIDWANMTTMAFESTQHGILNHYCELDGDDAYCETYYMFSGKAAQAPHLMSTGRYIDHFQKRNGEWRFANRVTIVEGKYSLGDINLGFELPPAYTPEEPCQAARDRNDVSYHRPPVPRRPKA